LIWTLFRSSASFTHRDHDRTGESEQERYAGDNARGWVCANCYTVKTNQPNWPPQSPVEALLSSPSARKKYERQRERNSVSPSPSKRRPMSRGGALADSDGEEDEETLQLKLQAIEAKLKLKALQRKRDAGSADNDGSGASSRAGTAMGMRRLELPRPQPKAEADVEIPRSPVRIRRAPDEPRSPARVLLGIDKGLTARDISLKRPGSSMTGGLSRSASSREPPKIKSFSDRIAESRSKEKERGEKQEKAEERRSRGFGLHTIEGLKDRPSLSRTSSSQSSQARSSQDMPPPPPRSPTKAHSRSKSDLGNMPSPRPGSTLSFRPSESSRPPSVMSKSTSSSFGGTPTSSKYAEISSRDDSTDGPGFEPFSGLHLKSREMQHNVVTRTLEGKTVLTIPQLLKTVKAPEYDPPDEENDYVILGVICSKSTPHNSKNAAKDQTKSTQEKGTDSAGKFMVIKLTDLKWELDLFLFDTGFSQFWKLPVGTLVAVLNPDIMPPRNRDSGKFSLKLSSSDDTIIELGTARDLEFCNAKRKDGKECGQWIDSRKTEFCEFHIQLQVEKAKKGRMQVNTMTGFGGGPGSGKFGMFGGRSGGPKGDELKREGKYHDRELHETVFIAPRPGGAAKLIDRDRQNWEGGTNREDRFRRQLAEKEKEKELAKKLGTMGDGSTGGDYMKVKSSGTPNLPARGYTSSQGSTGAKPDKPADVDFTSLLNRTSADVTLAPVKRKRTASTKSTASSDPVGWGFKYGRIPSPKKAVPSAFRGTREASPAKKKARLFLDGKGIREPGRESLGGLDVGLIAAMDDEDDDLEVV
jgi:minichromosome maintenance protein 10